MTEDYRIDRIRAVLSDPMLDEAMMLDQVNAILDSEAKKRPEGWTLEELSGTAEDRVRSVLEAFGVTVADMPRFVTALVRCVPDREPPPAPGVWFPGDTVPAGVSLVTKHGDLLTARATPYRITAGPAAAYIEVPLPSLTEWAAIVDRARAEREES